MLPFHLPAAVRREWALITLLTLLVLALPTRNSTLDAWYYAACVRYGRDLLLPHHLLYNAIGWVWVGALAPCKPDPLSALLVLNGLAYGGILLGLRGVLCQLHCPAPLRLALLAVAGCSFGMLRFGTENETYILPLLLSVLASGRWLRYVRTGRVGPLLAAGALAAAACLVHQLHVWWWLGLWLGTAQYGPRRGGWVAFAAPALVVPVAYWLALGYWHLPPTPSALLGFAMHDFVSGSAGAPTSWLQAALLTAANVVRTFGQVHGSTLALLRRFPVLALIPLLTGLGVWWAWRRSLRHPAPGPQPSASPAVRSAAARTHGLILLGHLLFAAWAAGNAEFMVMLPVLLSILLGAWQPSQMAQPLTIASAGLLSWNLAFGLLPNHLVDYTNLTPLLGRIQQTPQAWFLLKDYNLVQNRLHYLTGRDGLSTILPAPADLAARRHWTAAQFRQWLRAQQRAGRPVYTDALGGPQLLDRAQLLQVGSDEALLRGSRLTPVDSFPTFFGPRYLTVIQPTHAPDPAAQ